MKEKMVTNPIFIRSVKNVMIPLWKFEDTFPLSILLSSNPFNIYKYIKWWLRLMVQSINRMHIV